MLLLRSVTWFLHWFNICKKGLASLTLWGDKTAELFYRLSVMLMPSFEKRGIKIFIVWGNSFLRTQSTYFKGKRLEPSGLSPHGYSNHHHSWTLHGIGYTRRRASLVQNVVGKLKRVFFWSSRRYPGHIDLESGYEVGWLDQLLVHCYSDSYMGQVLYFSDNLSLHLLRRSLTMPPYHPNLLLLWRGI